MRCLKSNLHFGLALVFLSLFSLIYCSKSEVNKHKQISLSASNDTIPILASTRDSLQFDTALYNARLLHLAHNKPSNKWPVKTVYPLTGAILPYKRIVTYYGNFYSTHMGHGGTKYLINIFFAHRFNSIAAYTFSFVNDGQRIFKNNCFHIVLFNCFDKNK